MSRSTWVLLFVVLLLNAAHTASAVAQPSRVFVTSTPSTGSLGGLAGADQVCEARAVSGNLVRGVWVAWLSTSTVDAIDRIESPGPFVRAVSGSAIADDVLDLTDGALENSISDDEFGNPLDVNVWTGTTSAGLFEGDSCSDWQSGSAGDTGHRGNSPDTSPEWTDDDDLPCNSHNHLYCFENPGAMFSDGFESGDTSAWSSTLQ